MHWVKKHYSVVIFADFLQKKNCIQTTCINCPSDQCNLCSPRFVVGSNRVIFMLRDGSMAWEVKDFLVSQERCMDVTVEGQVFPGKAAKKDDDKYKKPNEVNAKKKSKKKTESKKPDLERNTASQNKQELWMKTVYTVTGPEYIHPHGLLAYREKAVKGFYELVNLVHWVLNKIKEKSNSIIRLSKREWCYDEWFQQVSCKN